MSEPAEILDGGGYGLPPDVDPERARQLILAKLMDLIDAPTGRYAQLRDKVAALDLAAQLMGLVSSRGPRSHHVHLPLPPDPNTQPTQDRGLSSTTLESIVRGALGMPEGEETSNGNGKAKV